MGIAFFILGPVLVFLYVLGVWLHPLVPVALVCGSIVAVCLTV